VTASRGVRAAKLAARASVSVSSAARSGDALATLVALRDRLAVELDHSRCKRNIARLAGQFVAVLAQIEVLKRSPRTVRTGVR
jgi:hypothetical protein